MNMNGVHPVDLDMPPRSGTVSTPPSMRPAAMAEPGWPVLLLPPVRQRSALTSSGNPPRRMDTESPNSEVNSSKHMWRKHHPSSTAQTTFLWSSSSVRYSSVRSVFVPGSTGRRTPLTAYMVQRTRVMLPRSSYMGSFSMQRVRLSLSHVLTAVPMEYVLLYPGYSTVFSERIQQEVTQLRGMDSSGRVISSTCAAAYSGEAVSMVIVPLSTAMLPDWKSCRAMGPQPKLFPVECIISVEVAFEEYSGGQYVCVEVVAASQVEEHDGVLS